MKSEVISHLLITLSTVNMSHKTVECDICQKKMRSDNLKQHLKVHEKRKALANSILGSIPKRKKMDLPKETEVMEKPEAKKMKLTIRVPKVMKETEKPEAKLTIQVPKILKEYEPHQN